MQCIIPPISLEGDSIASWAVNEIASNPNLSTTFLVQLEETWLPVAPFNSKFKVDRKGSNWPDLDQSSVVSRGRGQGHIV